MKNRNFKPALGLLFLSFAALACNLPVRGSTTTIPNFPTLTPYPTSEFTPAEFGPDPIFFVEEFDQSLPEGWIASPGWSVGNGVLSVTRADAELEIPGDWQDANLFTRLRYESDGFALQFNRSESGSYQIDLTREGLTISWLPAGGDMIGLSQASFNIDQGWHDLGLTQAHGRVEILVDQEPVLQQNDLGLSPSGSFKLINISAGLLEIDRLVVGPSSQ